MEPISVGVWGKAQNPGNKKTHTKDRQTKVFGHAKNGGTPIRADVSAWCVTSLPTIHTNYLCLYHTKANAQKTKTTVHSSRYSRCTIVPNLMTGDTISVSKKCSSYTKAGAQKTKQKMLSPFLYLQRAHTRYKEA